MKVYQKGTVMKNIIAIIFGTLSYLGLYLSLMHIASRLSEMIPVFPLFVQIVLLGIALEVSFLISFTGADFIYTKKYALRVLSILQTSVLLVANIMAIGHLNWLFHLMSLAFMTQYIFKGFSKEDQKDGSMIIGLVLILCSLLFSAIVIWIAYR